MMNLQYMAEGAEGKRLYDGRTLQTNFDELSEGANFAGFKFSGGDNQIPP
jgi:hypothetical protein